MHPGSIIRWVAGLVAVVLAFSALVLAARRRPAAPLPVTATAETDPVHTSGDAADDAAIWVNPTNRSLSTIIGTDKTATGGLGVYDLAGKELHFYTDGLLNNVDVHYNFPLAAQKIDLAAATNRNARSHRLLPRQRGAARSPGWEARRSRRRSRRRAASALTTCWSAGKYYAFVTY